MTHGKHDCSMGHGVANASFTNAFAIGVVLNFAFVILEVTFGFFAHSLALIADAGHNMSDVLGLLLAWGAAALSRRAPTEGALTVGKARPFLPRFSTGFFFWFRSVRLLGKPFDVCITRLMSPGKQSSGWQRSALSSTP